LDRVSRSSDASRAAASRLRASVIVTMVMSLRTGPVSHGKRTLAAHATGADYDR